MTASAYVALRQHVMACAARSRGGISASTGENRQRKPAVNMARKRAGAQRQHRGGASNARQAAKLASSGEIISNISDINQQGRSVWRVIKAAMLRVAALM